MQVREATNLQVSLHVIRQRLRGSGRKCCKPAKKPLLTPEHAEARLQFCRENLQRDWSKVIFSDEKTFSSSIDSPVTLWRPRGQRYQLEHIRPQAASGRITAGFWGWMSSEGPGQLLRVSPPRFNSQRYLEVITYYYNNI